VPWNSSPRYASEHIMCRELSLKFNGLAFTCANIVGTKAMVSSAQVHTKAHTQCFNPCASLPGFSATVGTARGSIWECAPALEPGGCRLIASDLRRHTPMYVGLRVLLTERASSSASTQSAIACIPQQHAYTLLRKDSHACDRESSDRIRAAMLGSAAGGNRMQMRGQEDTMRLLARARCKPSIYPRYALRMFRGREDADP
jgi:hypothetical protein